VQFALEKLPNLPKSLNFWASSICDADTSVVYFLTRKRLSVCTY
jgi:hypothetical protein